MPRAKKTLNPETTAMEAGASYGEVSENIQAQQDIPLPDNRTSDNLISTDQTPVGQAPGVPLDAAQQFPNTVTPLTAPGQGIAKVNRPLTIDNKMRAATLLNRWADVSDDPTIRAAAAQLGQNLHG